MRRERPRKKERAKKAKVDDRLSSHPPSLSLPSSNATTPAPSAPPSTRSITSADPASAHVEAFSDFLAAFLDSYSPDAQHAIPYIDRQSSHPLDWTSLTSRLRLCAQKHALAQLDVDLLSRLLPFLLSSMGGRLRVLPPAARPALRPRAAAAVAQGVGRRAHDAAGHDAEGHRAHAHARGAARWPRRLPRAHHQAQPLATLRLLPP